MAVVIFGKNLAGELKVKQKKKKGASALPFRRAPSVSGSDALSCHPVILLNSDMVTASELEPALEIRAWA